ncbi:hypothetical protein LUCX_143 [Xanthomonas phage vB_XciM_LucasX]|nr:hypothetical protein LUCX_143 [Xanthomonas phage vB_XciM_LucasX]
MSTSKIAILTAQIAGPNQNNPTPHIRYIRWEGADKRSTALLRYSNKLPDHFLMGLTVRASMRQLRVPTQVERLQDNGWSIKAQNTAVRMDQELHLIHLGDFGEYACYVLHAADMRQTPHYLSVREMPTYGKSIGAVEVEQATPKITDQGIDTPEDLAFATEMFQAFDTWVTSYLQPYVKQYTESKFQSRPPLAPRSKDLSAYSLDVRQLTFALKYLRHSFPDSGHLGLLEGLLNNMRAQDDHHCVTSPIESYKTKAEWMRAHRTVVLHLGRQSGISLFAQMMAHSKTLVLAYDTEPKYIQFFNGPPIGPYPMDPRVYAGRDQATFTYDFASFILELITKQYSSVILYNTNSLTEFESPQRVIQSIYENLSGDLPRLIVLN